MSSLDILSMALRNLMKRKLRTGLTVTGVVVGCAAIVIMISLGLGINRSFEEQMRSMGDITKIEVYNGEGYYGWVKDALVIDKDFLKVIEGIEGVQAVSPTIMEYIPAMSGRYQTGLQITGIVPEAMEAFGYVAAEGRLLEEGDTMQIVFGSDVPLSFYNPRDAMNGGGMYGGGSVVYAAGGMAVVDVGVGGYSGEMMGGEEVQVPNVNVLEDRIEASYADGFGVPNYIPDPNSQKKQVKPYKLEGVGILERSENDWQTQNNCFMSLETVEKMIEEREKYQQSGNREERYGYETVMIKSVDVKAVDVVIEKLVELGVKEDNIYNPRTMVKSMQDMTGSLQMLLGAIGAVSLFVAAIGIANTMIMSIYERTREIGVMKVIGASIQDIKWLFLTEAAVIGVMGGVLGMLVSLFVSFIINDVGISFFDMIVGQGMDISYVPGWLCMGALAFSTVIGLASGYFPARRAMGLSALSAIRSE